MKYKYKAIANFNIFAGIPSKNERNFTIQQKIVLRKAWIYNNSIDGASKSLKLLLNITSFRQYIQITESFTSQIL